MRNRFASLSGVMRGLVPVLLGLLALGAAAPAHATPSNPAFLGIGMHDVGGPGSGPCQIDEVTRDSSASLAGLRTGDYFVAIDNTQIPNCNVMITQIQGCLLYTS